MFKAITKLALITLVLLAGGIIFSSGKALAYTNCPAGTMGEGNWGATTGDHSNAMAGLIVYASVGSYSDGSNGVPGQGNPLSGIWYDLNSDLPGLTTITDSQGKTYPADERIFAYPPGSGGRWSSKNFMTGETLHAGSGDTWAYSCGGWSVLGPGNDLNQQGNGYVLDCGETVGGHKYETEYWVSSISNPSGQSGRWEIKVDGVTKSQDVNHDPNNRGNFFKEINGGNVRLDLIWHPDKPKTQTFGSQGACTFAFIETDNSYYGNAKRTHVQIYGISSGRQIDKRVNSSGQWETTADQVYSSNPAYTNPPYSDSSARPTAVDAYVPDANGQKSGNTSKEWYYIPWNSNDVKIIQTVQAYVDTGDRDTTPDTWVDVSGPLYYNGSGWQSQDTTVNCYSVLSGTCQILDIHGDGPGGEIVTPGQVYYRVSITNTSRDGLQLWYPSLQDSSGAMKGSGAILDTWNSYEFDGSFWAPAWTSGAPTNPYTFSFTPYYYPNLPLGSACSFAKPIYQYFNIQPRAAIINTDEENPTTVTYTSGGYSTTGPAVAAGTRSSLTKQISGGLPTEVDAHYTADTYGAPPDHTYTYNNPIINAGDTFCAHTNINPSSGYHGPDSWPNIYTQTVTADSGCVKTVNRPYTHFTGGDVQAGGGFGQSCPTTSNGAIYAYNESSSKGGSGSQFGAAGIDIISGLISGSLRNSSPTAPGGLSFANTENIGGSEPTRTNGGYLGSAGNSNFCVPDYFSDKSGSTTRDNAATATAGSGAAQQWHKPASGTLTLNGGTIGDGVNQTIFVEGNVEITSDIKFANTSWGSVSSIPSFYLVVKNGNTHIDPGVKRLDGVYIAQPDTTSAATIAKTGLINTCWVGNNVNDIYNQCKNQLVVNGAFVADRVLLARSYSSLRFSQNKEHNLGGFASHNCGNAGKDVPAGATSASDCAAEIFNFSPELYMSQPNLNPRFGPSTGKFDAITSLSPVL